MGYAVSYIPMQFQVSTNTGVGGGACFFPNLNATFQQTRGKGKGNAGSQIQNFWS